MNILTANDVVQTIYRNYETQFNGEFRSHFGASMAGDPCSRKLYYNFRHAIIINHDGRLLKLFQRGHKEEFTFIDELKAAGFHMVTVDENGKQFRLGTDKNKHVSGSGDGFAQVLRESEHYKLNEWCVVEMKTHNDKSFSLLTKKGVRDSKPMHYTQMQLYMRWSKMLKALYIAVNKNNDELYIECINYDESHAERYEDRSCHTANSTSIPIRLHEDPSHFECRFCDYHVICHGDKFPLNVTCRTCVHVEPVSNGTWICNRKKIENIDKYLMANGCKEHVFHPDFLDTVATVTSTTNDYIEYEFHNGLKVKNGAPNDEVMDSITISAVITHGYQAYDENMMKLINEFDAKIITEK